VAAVGAEHDPAPTPHVVEDAVGDAAVPAVAAAPAVVPEVNFGLGYFYLLFPTYSGVFRFFFVFCFFVFFCFLVYDSSCYLHPFLYWLFFRQFFPLARMLAPCTVSIVLFHFLGYYVARVYVA